MARNGRKLGEPCYWAFFCRPDMYDAAEAISSGQGDSWLVKSHDVRAGDSAIIWQGRDRSGRRGILAFADVLSDPEEIPPDSEHWLQEPIPGPRVRIRYRSAPRLPLLFESGLLPPELTDLNVAKATGGTVFHVTPAEWDALIRLAGGLDDVDAPEVQEGRAVLDALAGRGQQGFMVDVQVRHSIEQYAMEMACSVLREEGWTHIQDVHATKSYDLHCFRDDSELRVEVKGTQSAGETIIVTPNEVRHAREFEVELIVVHGIEVTREAHDNRLAGGRVRRIRPWRPDDGDLRPLGYTWTCPST